MYRPIIHKTALIICISVLGTIFICLCSDFCFVKVVLPSLLETKFKSQISSVYDTAFPPLDPYLEKMGVIFQEPTTATCNNGPYSPSDPCSKYRASKNIQVDPTKAARWTYTARDLDDYLKSQYWQKATASERYRTFADILTSTDNYQTFVSYSFESEGVGCSITADYTLGENGANGTISVIESCSKRTSSPSEWLR